MCRWEHKRIEVPGELAGRGSFSVLEFYAKGQWDSKERLWGRMKYQGWGLGGCSTAFLWGWNCIAVEAANKESLKSFIDAFAVAMQQHTYNPHMVFCQIPADYEGLWWPFLIREVYGEIQPVYKYENRAHDSTQQRLFYLDTDLLFKWRENYVEAQESKADIDGSDVPNVGNEPVGILPEPQPVGNNRTIIKLGNGAGQHPIAPGEYFAAQGGPKR